MTDQNDDYYRRQARDAELQAQRAISDDDRATWLRLSQRWLGLVKRKDPSTDAEQFEDAVQQRGTHQDISQEEQ